MSDASLLKLLPHEDTPAHRACETWCHVLPGIAGDLRADFEGAGWARPEDWPALGRGLFDFVSRVDENPAELWPAAGSFSALPGSRGFDSGLVSPILNALRPDDFLVVNAATRTALAHVTGAVFGSDLTEYPQANTAARRLVDGLRAVLGTGELLALRPQDSFALFCQWLADVRMLDARPADASASASVPDEATPPAEDGGLVAGQPLDRADLPPSADDAAAAVSAEAPAVDRDAAAPPGAPPGTAPVMPPSAPPVAISFSPSPALPALQPSPLLAPVLAPVLAPLPAPQLAAQVVSQVAALPAAIPADRPTLADPFALGEPFVAAEPAGPSAAAAWEEHWISRLLPIVERKGQLVLAGPPGAGKTYLAERLAARLLDGGDGTCERIAFHASWSYADFIQGLRPENGRRPGRFTAFCRQAAARRGRCVLLVDDLHRADVAAVFGEAVALLDRRGVEMSLPGGGTLQIPANVRLLATLDTSAAHQPLADIALARRFAVVTLPPGEDLLRAFHRETGLDVEGLIETLATINALIRAPERALGAAPFLREDLAGELPAIWASEIEPRLEHVFRDEPAQMAAFRWQAVAHRLFAPAR